MPAEWNSLTRLLNLFALLIRAGTDTPLICASSFIASSYSIFFFALLKLFNRYAHLSHLRRPSRNGRSALSSFLHNLLDAVALFPCFQKV